ncbi:MAG: linalool dehydratase/isomerase domain-containing protein [Candidatus Thorarchaeota archaeon]
MSIRKNKYLASVFVILMIFVGLTMSNLPGPATPTGLQTIDGVVYNFADYRALNRDQLGMFNYFNSITVNQDYNMWEGWHSDGFVSGMRHYFAAFTAYVMATLFETTPGYRTSQYQGFTETLITKMNTTVAEYGDESIEYWEWGRTSYPDYYFPDPNDSSGLYVGGFRGPANIMWTGHYALMQALYERNFNTGDMIDELTWFVNDWNTSLTTDGLGNPKEGGIWGVGLIPCEPHLVFVNCNSIPIYVTELFDNLVGTQYMESGMWNYGLDFLNNEMQDDNDLFAFVTQVSPTLGDTNTTPLDYPVVRGDDRGPTVSAYGTSWALMFLEYTQENDTITDYPVYMDTYGREVSNDQMYMVGSYRQPQDFVSLDSVLGSLFTMPLANQRGDYRTVEKLWNFWLGSSNQVWSEDGRQMHYQDGMASIMSILEPVLTGLCTWGTIPTTMRDLADARPTEFWDYPFISEADDDTIWVYQAEWDEEKHAFILTIEVDQIATLTFSNFDSAPTAYAGGIPIQQLTSVGSDYTLTLNPGTYNLVIL